MVSRLSTGVGGSVKKKEKEKNCKFFELPNLKCYKGHTNKRKAIKQLTYVIKHSVNIIQCYGSV